MATYYVRKNGSDAYSTVQAQDPATSWLTIDKAANEVAAGDTVYVGAGVYREGVTMDTAGSSGNQITFVGDVDGSQTGDAGPVIVSAYADESSTASRAHCFDINGKPFITLRGFMLAGGTNACVYSAVEASYEGCVFEDLVINAGHGYFDYNIWLDFGSNGASTGPIIRRCTLFGSGPLFYVNGNESADVDVNMVFENNVLLGGVSSEYGAFSIREISAGTYASGGVTINACLFLGMYVSIWVQNTISTTYPVAVTNSQFMYGRYGVWKETSNDGALTSNYNRYNSMQTPHTNVTVGGSDTVDATDPGFLGGLHDGLLYQFLGWSPYLPYEPIRLQDDAYVNENIGNASSAPSDDWYGNSRPMHGTASDLAAVEGRARPEQETTTVRTGANAVRFDGAGYHDFLIPVLAQSTTVSIYGRYDSNYTGPNPKLEVFNIPGQADQSDTMTGGANAWEELTATFTPDEAGVARVRISSQDTSATGEAFFDDLTVT